MLELRPARSAVASGLARPLWTAVAAVAVLLSLSIAQDLYLYGLPHALMPDVKQMLDVDYEKSAYTWLSSTLMFSAAALLIWLAHREAEVGGALVGYWRLLGVVFVLLSADEHVGVHERVSEWLGDHMPTHGLFHYGWVILALPLCLIGAVVSLRALRALAPATRTLLILSAATFVTGAVGLEMIDGAYAEQHGQANLTYRLLTNLEEGLEGAGLLLFLFGLDRHRRWLAR